jgi:hypothetical protein
MTEVTLTREHHYDTGCIRRINNFLVSYGSSGLDHAGNSHTRE